STNHEFIANRVIEYLSVLNIDFEVQRDTYAFTDSLYSKYNNYNDKINAKYVFVLNSLNEKAHKTEHILLTQLDIEYCHNKTTYLTELLKSGRYRFFPKKVQLSDCYKQFGIFIAPGGSSTQKQLQKYQ
ncbi:MAG TPA: hypothetical protein DCL21_07295, partial [Alphaproteobacteria bacterium]|nr:hypothetical protein [Alphaproteobacteria bacterium]